MKLGLDFYDTVTAYPSRFKSLAQTVLDSGGEVYLITAVKPENITQVAKDIDRSRVPYTDVDIVTYDHHRQVPALKLEKARLRHLDIMIDDRLDTCQLLAKRGYTALAVAPRK